jgi:ABC-type multidrug transport system fused ATPase/permease subunit
MSLAALIRSFVRRHAAAYAAAALMLLGVALLTVWLPRQIGHLIDALVARRLAGPALWRELGWLLAAGAGIYVFRVGWRIRLYAAAYQMGIELRRRLHARLAIQGPRFYQTRRTGDLMALATNDVDAVEMAAGEAMLAGFDGSLTLVLVVATMALGVDGRLAAIALLPFPLMAWSFAWISRHVHDRSMQALDRFGALNDHVQETLSGVRTLRALGLEARSASLFAELAEKAADAAYWSQRWEARYEPAVGMTLATSIVLSLGLGGWLVWHGELTIGQLTSFGLYLTQLIWPMFAAGWVLALWQRGRAAWTRLSAVLDEPLAIDDDGSVSPVRPGDIALRDVRFAYPGSHHAALDGLSLHITPGTTLGLVGPTGSGKSTLLKLLLRQWTPQAGQVSWGGVDLADYTLEALRAGIAWVPQEPILFSASVAENIALARPGATLAQVQAVAELAAVHDDILRLPQAYDTPVGERGVTLSGGQRQRVAIARALLADAPLLLLDDALSAVDTETEHRILEHLRDQRLGRTVIIVSHRLSAVADADLVAVLRHGHLAERGTHAQLLAKGVAVSWYAQQWRIQQLELSAPTLPPVAAPQGGFCSGPAEPDPRRRLGAPTLPPVAAPQGGFCCGPAEPDPRRRLGGGGSCGAPGVVASRAGLCGGWWRVAGMNEESGAGATVRRAGALLWRAARPDGRHLWVGALWLAVAAGLDALGPVLGKAFIDRYLLPRDPAIGAMGGLLFGALVAGCVASWVRYRQLSRLAGVAMRSVRRIREAVYGHVLRLPMSFFDKAITGQLVSRVTNDTEAVKQLYVQVLFVMLDCLIMLATLLVTMAFLDWRLMLIVTTLVPAVFGIVWLYQRLSAPAVARTRELRSELNAQTAESISGMAVLQATGAARAYGERYARANGDHYRSRLAELRANALLLRPALDLLNVAMLAVVIAVFGLRESGGALSAIEVGVLYAFVTYVGRVTEPLIQLTMQFSQLQQAMIAAARVNTLLDEAQAERPAAAGRVTAGAVTIESLDFAYTPGTPVLRQVSLAIAPGEFIGVVGPTGSGKSSLLSLLLRFYPVTHGRLSIDGQAIATLDEAAFRDAVGLVPQEPFLLAASARENIAMGRPLPDAQVEEAARAAGAHGFIARLEQGYDTLLGEGGARLAVGEKQLIAIARALAGQPRLLLLDEATSHVDSETEAVVQRALAQLRGRLTLISIAHRLSTIRDADRIVVLNHGRIEELGPHEALMQIEGGLYRRLVELQQLTSADDPEEDTAPGLP